MMVVVMVCPRVVVVVVDVEVVEAVVAEAEAVVAVAEAIHLSPPTQTHKTHTGVPLTVRRSGTRS